MWIEKNVASEIIVDGVLLYGRTAEHILDYFRTVLDIMCRTLAQRSEERRASVLHIMT